MKRTRPELDKMLATLEADIPRLLRDRNRFFHAFEDRALEILGYAQPADDLYVMTALKAMVDRAGVND